MDCKCKEFKEKGDLLEIDMAVYSYEHLRYVEFDGRDENHIWECPQTKIVFMEKQPLSYGSPSGPMEWMVKRDEEGEWETKGNGCSYEIVKNSPVRKS